MPDQQRFLWATEKISDETRAKKGIGTLGEKTLHAVLKYYYEPDDANHEIAIGRYVADICGENGVIEIQTRQFRSLRKKLTDFLSVCEVTVVYPVARQKWLIWVDAQAQAVTKKRKSPKIGSPYEILPELYKIKPLLHTPGLHFKIALIDLEEYRCLNGWDESGKKGASRYDRIPLRIDDEIVIDTVQDYAKLVPASLNETFTVSDYQRTTRLSLQSARIALNVLFHTGAVVRCGKKGNAFIYKRCAIS